jgi:hypothetical protein
MAFCVFFGQSVSLRADWEREGEDRGFATTEHLLKDGCDDAALDIEVVCRIDFGDPAREIHLGDVVNLIALNIARVIDDEAAVEVLLCVGLAAHTLELAEHIGCGLVGDGILPQADIVHHDVVVATGVGRWATTGARGDAAPDELKVAAMTKLLESVEEEVSLFVASVIILLASKGWDGHRHQADLLGVLVIKPPDIHNLLLAVADEGGVLESGENGHFS